MQATLDRILDLSPDVRYVAIYRRGILASRTRANLSGPSSAESDKYEELIVNPTLLTLARQRGNIDCGGLQYLLIRYGHFFEFVAAIEDGHVSVGLEPTTDLRQLVSRITEAVSALQPGPA